MQHGPFGEARHGLVIVLEPREKSSTADSSTAADSIVAEPGGRPIEGNIEGNIVQTIEEIVDHVVHVVDPSVRLSVRPTGRLSERPCPIARRGVACFAHVASLATSALMQSARIERIRWSITRTAPAVESVAAAIASIEESSA
jgi:hypothetical protein